MDGAEAQNPAAKPPVEMPGFLFKTFLIIKKLVTLITRDERGRALLITYLQIQLSTFGIYLNAIEVIKNENRV